ncbi:TIR domain-containing protein [Nocardia vinacea]|uniref:nSTAND1 domain-containing NTPase n=1 Tax=Nocardia vinacea TaxID=96468 RepID=UPI002E0F9384|nr:TIR domain-containing protein [Nocardia vinacea]
MLSGEGPIVVSRVFISHSSRDNAWAIAVKQWLVEQQGDLAQEIFLDIDPETGIHSGQRWKDALREAKERCEAVVCLLSRNWLGSRECEAEYRAAEYFGKRIYSAQIEALHGSDDITREWQRCDLYGDGPHTKVHIGSRREPVMLRTTGLQQLLTGLRAAGIGTDHFPWPPADEPDRAPYRGWDPYEPVDAAVFFGRDSQILRAMDALRAMRTDGTRPLFVVVGPSGTGKSSFLRAGLIPRLRRDDRHFVALDTMRPERGALTGTHGLAVAVHSTRRRLGRSAPDLGDIKTALTEKNTTLLRQWLIDIQQVVSRRLVDATAEAPTLVLPIDQAEELLSADAGPEGARMLEMLADLLTGPVGERLSLITVLTMRTDRYEHLRSAPQLIDVETVIFDDLKPMPRDRFRDIITSPARRSARHLDIAPDLVDRLLVDCGDGADTLPLLSLTLGTLHRDYGGSGELTLAHYTKLGGIDKVVATEIDNLLSNNADTRDRELALLRSAFIPFLATIAPDGEQPLRRIARWSDLPPDARPLIDRFVDSRLLVKDHRINGGDDRGWETVVEVALESLLRQWDDLAGWLREEADDLRTAENLERAAADWSRNNCAPAWLLSGPRLTAAETLAQRPGFLERLATVRDYLTASREHDDARHADELREAKAHADALRKRARTLIALATVAMLVAVTAGFYYLSANAAKRHATNLAATNLAARLVQDAQQQLTTGHDERRGVLETLAAQALSPATTMTALLAAQYQIQNIPKIVDVRPKPDTLAVSPDGRWMVAGYSTGVVRVWDMSSAAGPRVLTGTDAKWVAAVAVSPDGRWVIASDGPGVVRVWDMNSAAGPRVLTGTGNKPVDTVALSPDGRWVVAGDRAGVVRVWDTSSAAGPRALTGTGNDRVASVAVSPDGRWVVAGDGAPDGGAGVVRAWDLDSAAGPRVLTDTDTKWVTAVAVSPDGRWVIAGGTGGAVRVWDTYSTTGPRLLAGTERLTSFTVDAVAVSPDGRWVVGGGGLGVIHVWDMSSSAGPRVLTRTGRDQVAAVAVSPDGRWVVAGNVAGVVRVWDMSSIISGRRALPEGIGSFDAAVSPDGRWVVARDGTGILRVWDTSSAAGPRVLTDTKWLGTVALSPGGRWVVAGDNEGGVRVWDMSSAVGPRALPGTGTEPVNAAVVSLDGYRVVTDDDVGVVRVWDTRSAAGPRVLPDIEHRGPLALSPDGRWLVAGDLDGAVRVWDLSSATIGQRNLPGVGTDSVDAVAVSPDGRWVVAGDSKGAVRVWDLSSATIGQRNLPGVGTGSADAVAVSADGRWVAAADLEAIRVWSTDSNQNGVAVADQNMGSIKGLAFDPRNPSISAVSRDGLVAVYPLAPDPKILCSRLTTTMSKTEWDDWVTPDLPPARLCDGLEPPTRN